MQGSLSILFDFGTSGKVAADWANQWKALAMHRQLANEIRIGHSQFTSSPTNMIKPLSSQSFENSALIDLFFIMDVKDMKMSLERSSFRRNFQRWVEANYGENSRTKTITQAKYNKICMYLLGQPGVDTDAKFRFWVKSKGFRITTAEDGQGYGNLFVPVKVPHTRSNEAMYPYDHQTGLRAQRIEYRRVAVAEEFFDVISAVHINERGIHVGQKKTYRAVASTYAFLPREAVSYYLMSCSTCKLRIQRCNSILLKHGRPVSPSLSYSDPESSDIDASMSSHESDEDMISFGNGRIKKEPDEVFNENIRANGVDSPSVDRDLSSLNGNHKEFTRDGLSEQLLFAKGIIPGYQTYSVDQKQEVVNYAKETTVREAARKYSVPRSTVQVWCKHGHSKREKRSPGEKGGGGGRRLSYSNETDEKLYQWVMKQQENGTPVTRDAIQQQARLLIRDECPDFKASSGWVEKFLTRHNLCIQTRMSSNNPLEAVPICYVVPQSQVVFPSPGTPSNNVNSPRADGRSVTSEDTRSDSGDDDDMDDTAMANLSVGQSIIREPPNLQEVLKPLKSLSSPAVAVKDDEDDEGEGEEGEIEKTEINVNPERLKAFNMFVRLFVDENLDRLVPISKQPKDKILAIIQSCQRQFPEFRDRARKRIRTYLKSCRRLKKLREPLKRTADQMSTNPNMSAAQMAQVNNILASACASEVENKRARTEPDNLTAPFSAVSPGPSPNIGMRPHSPAVPAPVGTPEKLSDGATAHKPKVLTQNQLNPSEITAIRHLIAGYRESAAFLYRSADELEALIPQSQ